jgi:Na+/phosphate symporter
MSLQNTILKAIGSTLVLCLFTAVCKAQNPNNVEMADVMRDNGKIYVVVGVLAIILAGMFIYLISLNRKVAKLEQELK